jgi:hypothetical protein
MRTTRKAQWRTCACVASLLWLAAAQGQEQQQQAGPAEARQLPQVFSDELKVPHAECSFVTDRDRFRKRRADDPQNFVMGRLAVEVSSHLEPASKDAGTMAQEDVGSLAAGSTGTIDKYIFGKLQSENVQPAAKINDYEFIRRVTLDLTGRIPVMERVQSFVADKSADKRAKLIEELLASPIWTDKWTYYLGDRLKNTANMRSTGTNRFAQGREAFNKWIRDSLTTGKGYDQMTRELISAKGTNSWEAGEINWLIGGRVTGGPNQDIWDQQAANIAETFLGVSHANCVLCHNGRYHLDSLSLWGRNATRSQMWGMSAFLSKTTMNRGLPDSTNNNLYYWGLVDNPRAADYPLGSTSGNRPPRTIVGTTRNAAPVYPFSGRGPNPGENYRDALAREVTADPQFARATVNYIWKEFFGRGIVNPVNQFDLARLDPDNPPADCPSDSPCTLQPSHPELLRDLAKEFAEGGYSLKDLMRKIVSSEAYQLSTRYSGTWEPRYEALFARHLPRRLWGEEIADSIAMASNLPNAYTYRLDATTTPRANWAIQMPEPNTLPALVQSFIPGNRDDEERRGDGAVQQALSLMNDTFVTNRIRATGTGSTASLLQQAMLQSGNNDTELTNRLYMTVLSRMPSDGERSAGLRMLQSGRGTRTDRASSLLWTLFNKVDFIFNY